MFWNVFGIPECGLSRVEDYNDAQKLWWWDAEKAATVEKGKADESVTMPGTTPVPGLGGLAALACGAAGVRRRRHRST